MRFALDPLVLWRVSFRIKSGLGKLFPLLLLLFSAKKFLWRREEEVGHFYLTGSFISFLCIIPNLPNFDSNSFSSM